MPRRRFTASLSARIVLIVLAGQAALIVLAAWALSLRDEAAARAQDAAMLRDMAMAWHATAGALEGDLARLAADPALVAAATAADPHALAAALDPVAGQFGGARVEVLDRSGTVVLNSGGEYSWRPTLDAGEVAAVLAGNPAGGLRLDWARRVVAVQGRRLDGDRVVVLGVPADRLLADFARLMGGEVLVVNRRGRVLAGTAPALAAALPLDQGFVTGRRTVVVDGRTLSVAGLPLDGGGGLAAWLVLVRDASALAGEMAAIRDRAALGAGAALVLLVAGIAFYLRRAFAPLTEAVAVIDAVAAGDASVTLRSVGRAASRGDEIGRMAQAVERFRTQRQALDRLHRAEERQRRRQEAFIHREMTALAGTLAPLARDEILRDLRDVEDGDGGHRDHGGGLGVMGAAFRKMAVRVRQQHQHLAELIAELREALKVKTAFVQLQQELDIARQIQKSMLPLAFPADRPDLALHARMEPAKEVGGDFYDFFFIDGHRLGVVIADVSGKGVPAALFMAISRTLLRATALFGGAPGPCLENLNTMLAENNEKSLFVTVFYGILDLRDGTFTYANAGHNPPLWLRADGTIEALPRTGGAALAIIEGLPQSDRVVTLAPGEQVFLFTDGITEAQNAAQELFGDDRLSACLEAVAGDDPAAVIDGVLSAVQDFAGDAPQFDDITCLAVRWTGPQTLLAADAGVG